VSCKRKQGIALVKEKGVAQSKFVGWGEEQKSGKSEWKILFRQSQNP